MKACQSCGTLNEDKNTFCVGCSKKIEGTVLFCTHCGNQTLSSNKFCISCGNEIGKSAEVISQGAAEISPGNIPEKDIPGENQTSEIPQVPEITQASEKTQTPEITQTYGKNQTSEKAQVPPKKKQPYKKLVIALSIFIPVFFISLAGALLFSISEISSIFKPPAKPYENRFATDYSLSKDQKSLISEWGYPDGFLLAIDPDKNERVESWFYYEIGSELIFINGKYMDSEDLIVYDISKTKDKFTVYPYELTNKVTRKGIVEILGPPDTEDAYQNGKLSVMNYGTRLVIVLMDEKVIGATLFNSEPDKI